MVYFKVEKTPEDPSKIAMELAEALQSQFLHESEIRHYTTQIELERGKLRELTNLIFEVRKRRADGYVSTSRMDPWAEYDLTMLEEERSGTKQRALKYGKIVKEQQGLLRKHTNNLPRIRARLKVANEKAKEQTSGRS